ncbi:MAG TPA: hypothetical protein VNW46_03060 [Gemmatimonadaceae bacterium]|nr:hypothetical protein [Gemmatimonadaceae bacterium]
MLLLSACGSDSTTSPKSVVGADTVAVNPATAVSIEWYVNGTSDSNYYSRSSASNDYVETYNNNSGYHVDYRDLMEFALPALAGKGVVDSARMYRFVCYSYTNAAADSVVVDHVNWGAVYSDSASYNGQTLASAVGVLDADTTLRWHSTSVTSSVQADYAAQRTNSQYRVRYSSPAAGGTNYSTGFGNNCDSNVPNAVAGPDYLVIWSH